MYNNVRFFLVFLSPGLPVDIHQEESDEYVSDLYEINNSDIGIVIISSDVSTYSLVVIYDVNKR